MAVKVRRKKEASMIVIWSVLGLMLSGMGVLVSELWKLQVRNESGFEEVFRNQSVRRVRLPAVRGKIYDTNGECLADSVPNYCIAIYTAELRSPRSAVANTLELVHEIWIRVGHKPDITYHDIQRHLALTPNEPLVAWKDLDKESISRWRAAFEEWTAPPNGSLRRSNVPGLDLGKPIEEHSIVIQTKELTKRRTSTAANTLELVYEIAERLGETELPLTLQDIKDHIYARRPLPLLAWKNIDEKTMAKWADTCSSLAATDIYYQPARHYAEDTALSLGHLLGYTMEADAISEEEGERVHFDMRGLVGKKGLEDKYNALLQGEPGYKLVQIDVSGFHHRDLQAKAPQAGGDLQLAIDAHIQKFVWDSLTMHLDTDPFEGPVRGAVVVLDPNNGDVLAMASSPGFDPNRYIASSSYRSALMKDPSAPTFNRAVYGRYAPGSTFKPIGALGVLREHPEYAEVTHNCPGYYMVGKRKMRCNARYGHGELNLRQTIEHSCNVYMFQMALECGYEPIYAMAKDFGLGQVAGLFPDLGNSPDSFMANGDKYGNLPEKALNDTDTCNLAIGQGNLLVAPLQMAMVAAAIANGGHLYRPRLISRFRFQPDEPYQINPTWEIRRIDIPTQALEIVRGGMHDVVMSGRESAKVVQVGDIVIAGKTGTAEYGPKEEGKKITWMISFAPFDTPRYAIAFIVEDGVYGGTTVAPRLHELYQDIFEYDGTLERERGAGSGEQGARMLAGLVPLQAPHPTLHATVPLPGGER